MNLHPNNLPIAPMPIEYDPWDELKGEPTLLDRLETTLSRHWITRNGGFLLCGLAAVLITIGLLGMGRV